MKDAKLWIGFVYGFIVAAIVAALMVWGLRFWEEGKEFTCMSGLLELRAPLEDYVERHQGKFPLSLEELDWQKASPDAKGGCPKVRDTFPEGEGWRGYLYIPPRDDAPDDTPILLCWRHKRLLLITKSGEFRRLDK